MSPPTLQDGMVVMPRDEFEELLARAAERGARRALADVGLDGEDAAHDIREPRGLLEAFSAAKHTAWQTVIRLVTIGFLLALVAGAVIKLKVFNDLKTRGCNDILIAVVDGLRSLAEAIEVAFPATTVQTCIVHLIRNSLAYATCKERRAVAAGLRPVYTASTVAAAQAALEEFADGPWGAKYPTIVQSWKRAREYVIPFFAFPPQVRRVLHTTNVIESLHMQLRKIIKTRGHFPSDEAATKLLWLALRNVMSKSVRSTREWKCAMNPFAILYGERFTSAHP